MMYICNLVWKQGKVPEDLYLSIRLSVLGKVYWRVLTWKLIEITGIKVCE